MADTKSLSPPTSVSEISADVESRPDENSDVTKMEVDAVNTEPLQERLSDEGHQESMSTPTDASQDSSVHTAPVSPDTSNQTDKVIPRLVNTTVPLDALNSVEPELWTPADVARFLTVNDCQPYCDNFTNITGSMMLQLSKDEIIELLEMKVGPSLKIFDLIQQLKCKIKQPQCRLLNFK
ncbi:polycomb protein Sfmbt-like [Choristoneura fumiferana]